MGVKVLVHGGAHCSCHHPSHSLPKGQGMNLPAGDERPPRACNRRYVQRWSSPHDRTPYRRGEFEDAEWSAWGPP